MLSHPDHETPVRIGRETPMGSLFRLYWILLFFSKILSRTPQPKRVMLDAAGRRPRRIPRYAG